MTEAALVDRGFLRVAGPDAERYLQGQLSQDLSQRQRTLSFLLDPSGKVVALLRVVRHGDGSFVLDTDGPAVGAVEERLRRFLLRSKVSIDPVPGAALVRVFDGPPLPQRQVSAAWSDDSVQDVLTDDAERTIAELGATRLEAGEYERRRLLAAVPVSGVDIGPDTIPAEAGAWTIEAAVSFTKGCYTGQELVARIDSRGGNVPRPLRVLTVDGAEPGDEVRSPDGDALGRVTSAAAGVALGPVARKAVPGDAVLVGDRPGTILR